MKRILLSLLLLTSILSLEVSAQSKLKFGLMGGLNISEMRFDQTIIDKDNNAGFFIGPMVDLTLPIIGLSVDAAVLYDQQKIGAGEEKETLKLIDVPINARYNIGLGSMLSVYLATGPQFSFNVGDDDILKHEYKLKSSQFSWNVGAGLTLMKHLKVGYRYNIGLGDYADKRDMGEIIDTVKKKDGTHHVSVAYIF